MKAIILTLVVAGLVIAGIYSVRQPVQTVVPVIEPPVPAVSIPPSQPPPTWLLVHEARVKKLQQVNNR